MATKNPVTVLHYTGYDDDRGGIVSVIRHLAAAGASSGVMGLNVGYELHREPPLAVLAFPRVEGEKIDLVNLWRAHGVAHKVRDWLRAQPGRVFHGHSRAGLLVALWLWARGERRVVVSVHCYGRQRWFYRWAARRLGAQLFWLSPAMRSYYGAPGEAWEQCLPGSVTRSRVQPARPIPGCLRLGGVGALVRWKGWHRVIAALAQLPAEVKTAVTFTHVGGGDADYLAELRSAVGRAGLGGRVIFLGEEPTSERLLGEIDALVIASEHEPFSMAMLEALAAGVPVIAADSGGAVDILQTGVNGCLYRAGDPAALAEVISRWIAARPDFDRDKIRQTVRSADEIAARWAELYAQL